MGPLRDGNPTVSPLVCFPAAEPEDASSLHGDTLEIERGQAPDFGRAWSEGEDIASIHVAVLWSLESGDRLAPVLIDASLAVCPGLVTWPLKA